MPLGPTTLVYDADGVSKKPKLFLNNAEGFSTATYGNSSIGTKVRVLGDFPQGFSHQFGPNIQFTPHRDERVVFEETESAYC